MITDIDSLLDPITNVISGLHHLSTQGYCLINKNLFMIMTTDLDSVARIFFKYNNLRDGLAWYTR